MMYAVLNKQGDVIMLFKQQHIAEMWIQTHRARENPYIVPVCNLQELRDAMLNPPPKELSSGPVHPQPQAGDNPSVLDS